MIKLWMILLLARSITAHCRIGLTPSTVICENTTFEDYVVETMELDFWNQGLELSIKDSKIPVIYRMLNVDQKTDFIKLSVNFCEVKEVRVGAFSDLHSLQEINLGFNQITDLSFMNALFSVGSVNLTHNLIEVVDFASFNFFLLDLSFNRIVTISLCNTVPRYLYLNDNKITKLEMHFIYLIIPKFALYIFNNNINSITIKDAHNFIGANKVSYLLDFSNSITNLSTLPRVYWESHSIYLSNNNLKKLEESGSYFSHNYIIDFSNCSLEYINPIVFQRMANINTLNLSHNVLNLLSRRYFYQSTILSLDLSYNLIESINSVFDESSIKNLNLSYNKIKEVNSNSFQNVKTLISLDLSGNQNIELKTGGFRTCHNLNNLNVASCNMSTLIPDALKGLNSLKVLNFSCNSFQTLHSDTFKHLTQIEQIDLRYNQLTVVPSMLFSSLPICSVNLSGNNLSIIEPQAFYNLSKLKHMEINHNKNKLTIQNEAFYNIGSIGEIQIKHCTIRNFSIQAFNQISNFESLNLKDTIIENKVDFYNHQNYNINLKQLHLTVRGPLQTKTFTELVFLEKLYIWNSEIQTVEPKAFLGLYKLKSFQLPGCNVKELSKGALEGLFHLESLDAASLFNNTAKLQSGTFKHLHQIEFLDLSWLQLEQIETKAFQGLRNLHSLNLSGNKLVKFTDLTFTGLLQLEKLNLSHNLLNFLERSYFRGLDNLNVLDLSNNKISDMDWGVLQAFPNLMHLNLAYNNLTEFKVGAFSNLLVLNTLNLAYNSISELLFESFLPLTSLESLNLEDNNLKTIKHISLASNLKSLKRIGIANNKWKCEYLAEILVTFRNRPIQYDTTQPAFYEDNIDGIRCIDLCKYLLCLQDSHGIN